MRFKVLPNSYDTTDKQVFYALSLMKSGITKAWKDQYLASRKGQQYLAYADFVRNRVGLKGATRPHWALEVTRGKQGGTQCIQMSSN